jgi:lipopolysaccharide transport system permease protein
MNDQEYDLIIEAGKAEKEYWHDIWRFRELFYFMAWRDLLVRYKQTVIGVAWSVIRPIMTMLAFVLVFSKVAKLDSHGIPYPILVFVALLPWQLFSNSLSEASNSLIANSNMISKVYFPRMIIPISSIIVCLADFLFSLVILIFLMIFYRFVPDVKILLIPLFLIMALLTAIGAGLWLAALNVKYRDFRYVVPFIVQFGLYVSPVGFDSSNVPLKWRALYSLNPMVGVIDGFRWCFFGTATTFYWPGFFISLLFVFMLLFVGIRYFRATEKTFADKI